MSESLQVHSVYWKHTNFAPPQRASSTFCAPPDRHTMWVEHMTLACALSDSVDAYT